MLQDLVKRSRSYRRFHQDEPIDLETLRELVNLARLSPSGANRQPLKFALSCEPGTNAAIFSTLSWASHLPDWPGPGDGERPAAYILILGDTAIARSFGVDHGIAAQSILLGAVEKGFGGCIIASIDKPRLRDALGLDPRFRILLALALGKPKETIVIEELGPDGDIKYWRDPDGTHHLPKRSLEDLILD